MTDPLSPEEIAELRAIPATDGTPYNIIATPRDQWEQLVSIAEDHALLRRLRDAGEGAAISGPVPDALARLREDNARLRAELKGQRCGGNGYVGYKLRPDGLALGVGICPGCPACKPTPKSDGCKHMQRVFSRGKSRCFDCDQILDDGSPGSTVSCKDDSGSTVESVLSTQAAPVSLDQARDVAYAAGYQAARDDAANGLGVQIVELGPRTLRALYEVLYEIGLLSDTQRMAGLAELARTEEQKP